MLRRLKNRTIAKVITMSSSFAKAFIKRYKPLELDETPWSPLKKPLSEARVALVTTAGVHLKDQKPFDMENPEGDPTFRVISSDVSAEALTITHDYYDHQDADRDINIVFPLERLAELWKDGLIGAIARRHYGFMGHIVESRIPILLNQTAPMAAEMMKADSVDVVLLSPG